MILGIDIGGTNIKWAEFDSNFKRINRNSKPTEAAKGPEHIINSVAEVINHYPGYKVGIGFPSVVSEDGFVHLSPNMPGFINIDLKKELELRTNHSIKIDNDANAAALAELHLGAGKNINNFIYVTLGTGVGGTIIINRKLFKGDNSGAGEIGYTTINFDETRTATQINRRGILEDYAGLPRITSKYIELGGDSKLSMKEVSVQADNGDTVAIKLFQHYGEMLGYGIASAMNLLDLNYVIIGGGLSQVTNVMFNTLKDKLIERSLAHKKDKIHILKAQFLNDAGVTGAASLTIE
jgi:glucokinase